MDLFGEMILDHLAAGPRRPGRGDAGLPAVPTPPDALADRRPDGPGAERRPPAEPLVGLSPGPRPDRPSRARSTCITWSTTATPARPRPAPRPGGRHLPRPRHLPLPARPRARAPPALVPRDGPADPRRAEAGGGRRLRQRGDPRRPPGDATSSPVAAPRRPPRASRPSSPPTPTRRPTPRPTASSARPIPGHRPSCSTSARTSLASGSTCCSASFAGVLRRTPGRRLIKVGGPLTPTQARLADDLGVSDVDRRPAVLPSRDARGGLPPGLARAPAERGRGLRPPRGRGPRLRGPVLASDLAVLREVGGDAAVYRPVGDVAAWTEAALALLDDHRRRSPAWQARRASGIERARRFQWSTHVESLLEIYEAINGSRSTHLPEEPGRNPTSFGGLPGRLS